MLNWIYFSVFIDFPQGPNPHVRSECSLKKSEHVQFHAVPLVIAWEILKLTLGGGLIKFRWSKFYSAGVYFQLKLHALTHAEWPISFHFLFQGETDGVQSPGHPGIASQTISGTETELLVPIQHFAKALIGLIFHKGSVDQSVRLHRSMIVLTCIRYIRTGKKFKFMKSPTKNEIDLIKWA